MNSNLSSVNDRLRLVRGAAALASGDIAVAERACREALRRDPRNVEALRMLADIGARLGRLDDASTLLAACLNLEPDCHPARLAYADVLFRTLQVPEALAEVDRVLLAEPEDLPALLARASMLTQAGSLADALQTYERILQVSPEHVSAHLGRGHALKTLGRLAEALIDFRRALALAPGLGETYWHLANLKTFRFDDTDIARMLVLLGDETTNDDDRVHLCFSLGKALEDRGDYDRSFRYYEDGNERRRRAGHWDAQAHHLAIERIMRFFGPGTFTSAGATGDPSNAPIFVVGMPRAGSTLLEQILASHSQVDGTMELPDIPALVQRLNSRAPGFPETLTSLSTDDYGAMARDYLARTSTCRSGAPRFVDKMPNNFGYIGLIHLMFPNATIIDARRNPMACGFSIFKQLFANGQEFSYSLADIGRYYRDYVAMMAHWDTVLPGRVLRVDYEAVVTDTETEIRRVLAHCGLAFERECLAFFNTDRPIRTPSSEQVRRPINRDGLEQWRHFESHLEPLRDALAA